jgi:hypothetical protein
VGGEPQRGAELVEGGLAALVAVRGSGDGEVHLVRQLLVSAYVMVGDWRRARDHMRDAVEVARSAGRKPEEAAALELLGRASLGTKDPHAVSAAYRASASLATEVGDDTHVMFARHGLGRALVAIDTPGAAEEAIEHLEWVLPRIEAMTPPMLNYVGLAQAALADALWRRNRRKDRARAQTAAQVARDAMIRFRDGRDPRNPRSRWYRANIEREIRAVEAWQA